MFLAINGEDVVRDCDEFVSVGTDEFPLRRAILFSERESKFREMAVRLQVFDHSFWSNYTIAIVPISSISNEPQSIKGEPISDKSIDVYGSLFHRSFSWLHSLLLRPSTQVYILFVTAVFAYLKKRN